MDLMGEDSKIEKRQYLRIPYREPVQLSVGDFQEAVGSLSCDISEKGLRLQVNDFIPINSRIALEVSVNDQQPAKVITLMARVVWTRRLRFSEQYQVGLEFKGLDSEARLREEIGQFIKTFKCG